jgi:hypothetical protein
MGEYILAGSSPPRADDGRDGESDVERPARLFTLIDIVNHYCASQMTFLLEQTVLLRRTLTEMREKIGGGARPATQFAKGFSDLVNYATQFCFAVHFSDALAQIMRIHVPKSDERQQLDLSTMIAGLSTIHESIYAEMGERHFLFVAPDRIGYLEAPPRIDPFNITYQEHTFWGNGKTCSIRSAAADIKSAGNCLAAECHTAAVFHAMRVAEFGLRSLAKRLNVILTHKGKPEPIEFATWEKVITAVKNSLNAVSQMSHGPKRKKQLARFSELADRCTYMKDLWRNEVMHTRASYNRHDAARILQHVREFMQAVEKKS